MWDEAEQFPHLNPLPEGEEDTDRGCLWKQGGEIVREASGEGSPLNEANRRDRLTPNIQLRGSD